VPLRGLLLNLKKENSNVEMWKIIDSQPGEKEVMKGALVLECNFGGGKKEEGDVSGEKNNEDIEYLPRDIHPEFEEANLASTDRV
jgi:hypothetical protein